LLYNARNILCERLSAKYRFTQEIMKNEPHILKLFAQHSELDTVFRRGIVKPSRKYFLQFVGAMIAYIVLMPAILVAYAYLSDYRGSIVDTNWRYLVILIPVIPIVYGITAFVRAVGELDELQRRIQLEAFAFSLGSTAVLTFGYGFLELAGLPRVSWLLVLPLMAFLWGVGLVIATRRYR
jgi:hypothetical protein